MHTYRFSLVIVATLAFVTSIKRALASASFGCRAADKNIVSLVLEGVTPRDGSSLSGFGSPIEIEPGKKIELERADVTKFVWKKNIRLIIRKTLGRRSFIEIAIRTYGRKNEFTFPGSYVLHTEKVRRAYNAVS